MIPSIFTQAPDCLRLPFKGYNSGCLDVSVNYAGSPSKCYAVRVFDPTRKGSTIKINGTISMGLPQPSNSDVEDARLFWHDDRPHVAYTEGHYQRTPFHAKQRVAELNDDLTFKCAVHYPWGDHPTRSEKNHQFFSRGGELFAVYSIAPVHRVINVTTGANLVTPSPTVWPYGYMAGGTPPVRTPDGWVSFFHSFLPCRQYYRRYFAAAYCFDDDFTITGVTPPLWVGSERDERSIPHPKEGINWAPLVVFPMGAQLYGREWEVTAGVNDMFDVRLFLDHADLKFEPPSAWNKERLVYFQTRAPAHPAVPWERLGGTLGKLATNSARVLSQAFCAPGVDQISEQQYNSLKKQRL